jgi:hypothetical protein
VVQPNNKWAIKKVLLCDAGTNEYGKQQKVGQGGQIEPQITLVGQTGNAVLYQISLCPKQITLCCYIKIIFKFSASMKMKHLITIRI